MSLPFELTTFPNGAIDIIRYLGQQDDYTAFDDDLLEATGLSDRAYGKAIRRLVTKEYIELQYEGSYALTEIGIEAAEAIAVHDEEMQYEADVEEADFIVEEEEFEVVEFTRRVLVIAPRAPGVGVPAYLFLRVMETEDDPLPLSVDVVFELRGERAQVIPDQNDTTVPESAPADPVRFEVTLAAPGSTEVTINALQVTKEELLPIGEYVLRLTAVDAPPDGTFSQHIFPITLQPGL
ncbi:MAG: hypothetical protein JXN59_01865 [Anaerolineae bacterium]|nr:hypothetical protein [Anaerolineae bacterium]